MPPTNHSPYNIEQMIGDENDPKLRAFLILLHAINQSLISNTDTTKDLSDKLDAHLTRFEKKSEQDNSMLNQVRGAWRVIAWVLGIVQVIGLGIWVEAKTDIKEIHAAIATNHLIDERIEARLQALEKRKP